MAETLEYARHLLTTRVGAPFIIDSGNLAGCFRVFNHVDFHLLIGHDARPTLGMSSVYSGCPSTVGWGRLEHKAKVSIFAGDSLAIEVFQQGNGVLSRKTGHLFEACNVERLAAQAVDLPA